MCDCLQLTIRATTGATTYVEPIAGTYNGSSYWYFTHDGQDIYIWDIGGGGTSWFYSDALGGGTTYGRFTPSPAVSCLIIKSQVVDNHTYLIDFIQYKICGINIIPGV